MQACNALLEEVDEGGQTAFFHAAASGHSSTCLLLLESGADIEVVEHQRGYTPLMWAASEGHEKVVEVLISYGAATDYAHPLTGQMAAHLAADRRHWGVVQRLQRHLVLPQEVQFHIETETAEAVAMPKPQDLSSLLNSLGLDKYIPVLDVQGIGLEQILNFGDDDRKSAGITLLGPKKMLVAISHYKK